MPIHIFQKKNCMKYDIIFFFIFERLGHVHDNMAYFFVSFLCNLFAMFRRKLGILIPNLYLMLPYYLIVLPMFT